LPITGIVLPHRAFGDTAGKTGEAGEGSDSLIDSDQAVFGIVTMDELIADSVTASPGLPRREPSRAETPVTPAQVARPPRSWTW
jgi:hypothetical protein